MSAITANATRPSLYKLLLETRAPFELGAFTLSLPLLQAAPKGDGHPVMVLPGFMTSDLSTMPLRIFLRNLGYSAYGWGQGRNYGRGIDMKVGVNRNANTYAKMLYLQRKHGQKVSLIGWSLGGIYARELARLAPDSVRQIITLGSPFTNNIRANNVVALFEKMSGKKIKDLDPELLRRAQTPPPVPSTAIHSRTDGIAAWECCIEQESPTTENIRVESSHTGLGHNPMVLWAIADRLAQKEGEWKPFDRTGVRKLIYGTA